MAASYTSTNTRVSMTYTHTESYKWCKVGKKDGESYMRWEEGILVGGRERFGWPDLCTRCDILPLSSLLPLSSALPRNHCQISSNFLGWSWEPKSPCLRGLLPAETNNTEVFWTMAGLSVRQLPLFMFIPLPHQSCHSKNHPLFFHVSHLSPGRGHRRTSLSWPASLKYQCKSLCSRVWYRGAHRHWKKEIIITQRHAI